MQTPNVQDLGELEFVLDYLQEVDPKAVDRIEAGVQSHLIGLVLEELTQLPMAEAHELYKAIQAYRGVVS